MRVTQSMYYDSIYGTNNQKLTTELFDVNKQIASGLKIQYASDDVRTFTETMRLDNEVTILGQIKKSTENGSKVADQTDTVLNEFNSNMERMRTLMVQAANGTNDDISLDAIANELRGIEKNLKGIANTSINGKYIFSGSAVDIKPIAEDGTYQGNDASLNALIGSNNKQDYNISGAELFLGEEVNRNRDISSNVVHSNLLNPTEPLTSSSSLRELMGDKNDTSNTDYFYLRGTKSDGTAIKAKQAFDDSNDISLLLQWIGDQYGNTGDNKIVDVTINDVGEIEVRDKLKGSSKLDFHLVGAVDYSGGTAADQDNIDDLDSGETTYPPAGDLYVQEFNKSGLDPVDGAATNIEGLIYDRAKFEKNGTFLSANAPQILKDGNAFAQPSTKISEVADLSQGTDGTLDGTTFVLAGTDIYNNAYDYTVVLDKNDPNDSNKNGSYFTPDGGTTKYYIYDMDPEGRKAVDADEMTYQQLMDVVNMVTTNSIPPANNDADQYDAAIKLSEGKGSTYLSYDGKIQFHDLKVSGTNGTNAEISLYDQNSNIFSEDPSVMTFNTNNSLTISDPKTDFFKELDEIITSVEDHKLFPDASSGSVRNVGIENSIAKMDDLMDHVNKIHAKVGAQSNTLTTALEQTQILEVSTMSLRSSVIDTDMAEASLRLSQLDTNYQAMLSTVGKISKLSLVNYL